MNLLKRPLIKAVSLNLREMWLKKVWSMPDSNYEMMGIEKRNREDV